MGRTRRHTGSFGFGTWAASLALALLGVVAGPGAPAASPSPEADPGAPATPSTPWGFNEDWGWRDGAFSGELATADIQRGAAIMPDELSASRFHVQWADVEAQRGAYDWSRTDAVYAAMQQQAARPVMLLYNAPWWAHDPAAACPSDNPCAYPPLPQYDADWQRFVAAAVERYPDVRAIEVWNEPNISRFWAPVADPARYATLLALAHEAVEGLGVTTPVVVGGLLPSGTTDANVPPSAFLRELYALGAVEDFDGIAVHPYPYNEPYVETMWSRIDAVTAVRDEAGDAATPLWITEIGISSGVQSGVPAEEQGQMLARFYRSIEGHGFGSFIIHRLNDIGTEGSFWNQTGVVGADGVPKSAYCELGAALGTPCS